jgi:hypothetical protein
VLLLFIAYKDLQSVLLLLLSSFNTEKLQLDEGYFPAHAWHDNVFFINFHFLQFFFFFLFSIR